MQAIIKQYEFPPIDCFNIDVNFDYRYGIWADSLFFALFHSANVDITCLNVNKDLLISILYFACLP
jgi:hypothetical protein